MILIFSTDPFGAALLGASVELAGYTPVFPFEGENPRDCLRRLRPDLVMIDCDHEGACTEQFLGPVFMTGTAVVLFSSTRSHGALEPTIQRFRLPFFTLPVEYDELARILNQLMART